LSALAAVDRDVTEGAPIAPAEGPVRGPGRARYRFTGRAEGDLAVDVEPGALAARRRTVVGTDVRDAPWTWLAQVHGRGVVTVTEPGQWAGARADAAVTAVPGSPLVVHTADCAPVVLLADGVVGVAHAGWRGLVAGVISATAAAMRDIGAGSLRAVLGPCIRSPCYPFGAEDLARVSELLGREVEASTALGAPALDLAAGVRTALARAGVDHVDDSGACTACEPGRYFSYRARAEAQRQAAVVWLAP